MNDFVTLQFRNSIYFLLELCQRHRIRYAPEVILLILEADPTERMEHIQKSVLCV